MSSHLDPYQAEAAIPDSTTCPVDNAFSVIRRSLRASDSC